MSQLTIVASIFSKIDKVELVKTELEKLIKITRSEQGCLQYDLHQNNQNPAHFLFYEKWESREDWQNHMHTEHLAAYIDATEGAVEDFLVHEMTKIA